MKLTRRQSWQALAGGAIAAATAAGVATAGTTGPSRRTFRHAVCRWCFGGIALDDLCVAAKAMGVEGIDLLGPGEWATAAKHGLECSLGSLPTPGGIGSIPQAFNRVEHHDSLEKTYLEGIPLAAKAGIKQVICFSGNRGGMDDATGLKNCAAGLKRIMSAAEQHGVTVIMELLNSKVDHGDYMCDHTEWGAALVAAVASERFKLLYDIYHMQIMEGDVIATIRKHHDKIAHYHTAGVPGRNEIDDTQELNYRGICAAVSATGFTGFLAQEFIPRGKDALAALRQGVEICSA